MLRSSRAVAISVVSAAGTLLTDRPKVTFSRTLSLGSCAIMRASSRAPASPRDAAEPERGVAAEPLGPRRRDEALERPIGGRRVVQRDRADRRLADAIVPLACVRRAAATSDDNQATLSSGLTSVSQTSGMPPASMSQSGVNVRSRLTVPFSSRAEHEELGGRFENDRAIRCGRARRRCSSIRRRRSRGGTCRPST